RKAMWTTVTAPGYAQEHTWIPYRTEEEYTIALVPPAFLQCIVRDHERRPLAGAELGLAVSDTLRGKGTGPELSTIEGKTAADGSLHLELHPGTYDRVLISHRAYGERSLDPVVARAGETISLEIVLGGGSWLKGRIVDRASGAPIAGAEVSA